MPASVITQSTNTIMESLRSQKAVFKSKRDESLFSEYHAHMQFDYATMKIFLTEVLCLPSMDQERIQIVLKSEHKEYYINYYKKHRKLLKKARQMVEDTDMKENCLLLWIDS